MRAHSIQSSMISMFLMFTLIVSGCNQGTEKDDKQNNSTTKAEQSAEPIVTFIELGSVRCIPCQKMQPIMESIEEKYGSQVKVVFHDVWTPEGKPAADKYNIELIPTQVFLDENGEEYFRHEGFFPEEELVEVLKMKGVK